MGWPITCPECDGSKGWLTIDGTWMLCDQCDGKGYVDEDELKDDDDDLEPA
jgi:hypothetical protein